MTDIKSLISFLVSFILLVTIEGNTNGQSQVTKSKNLVSASYLSLDGRVLSKGNRPGVDGKIHNVNSPIVSEHADGKHILLL